MLGLKDQDTRTAEYARAARAHNWDRFALAVFGEVPFDIDSGAPFVDPAWFEGADFGDLWWHYLWHPGELDTELWVLNNIAYGMIGTGAGGLAGLGAGALVRAIGWAAGSNATSTAWAGSPAGGPVGGKVGGTIAGTAGWLGESIGSFGGNFAGGWLGWGAAAGSNCFATCLWAVLAGWTGV